MENATKAMFMAAGVLISIMIATLGITLYSDLRSYVQSSEEKIKFADTKAFNEQFVKYINNDKLTIHDVVTAANVAYDINTNENLVNTDELYVKVELDGTLIENTINVDSANLLKDYNKNTYKCSTVEYSEKTGRVRLIVFEQN